MSNTDTPATTSEPRDEVLTECLATPVADWSPNIMAVFVHRIEHAMHARRKGPLEKVSAQLEELLHHVLASAPEAVRTAVLRDDGDPSIRTAFMLGQLSLAHQAASTYAHHRPDDAFYEAFDDAQTKQLVTALSAGPRTAQELATSTGQPLLDVRKTLRGHTALGIVDFRARFGPGVETGTAEYFLTPAAKQYTENPH